MEAILKFDLNEPDDSMAHLRAVRSLDITLVLWEFVYNTKKSIERNITEKLNAKEDISAYDGMDMVYEKLHELLNEKGLIIDDLIS